MESAVRSGTLAARAALASARHAGDNSRAETRSSAARESQRVARERALDNARSDGSCTSSPPRAGGRGELETNVTMTAEHVLLFRFLGLAARRVPRRARSRTSCTISASDGSWALYYDGPADLSTTIEAYVALKVLGVDPARDEMRKALDVDPARRAASSNARVFTKIWLALFGVYPWDGVPSLPPEIVYFPLWMPFNLYDFACWARGTVAPLTIVVSQAGRCASSASTSTRSSRPAREARDASRARPASLADVRREAAQALRTASRGNRVATRRSAASRSGSSNAKKPTAAGAAFSRRGSTR